MCSPKILKCNGGGVYIYISYTHHGGRLQARQKLLIENSTEGGVVNEYEKEAFLLTNFLSCQSFENNWKERNVVGMRERDESRVSKYKPKVSMESNGLLYGWVISVLTYILYIHI